MENVENVGQPTVLSFKLGAKDGSCYSLQSQWYYH